eukprot:316148_1
MITCWMPLMDVPLHKGPLAVCPKSHLLKYPIKNNYEYGMEQKMENEIEAPPDFNEFNKNAIWKTTNFKKGDVLIFDIQLIHAAIINKTKQFRISIDTRWIPKHSITYWCDAYIRFKNIKNNGNENKNKKENLNENEFDNDNEEDIMMDCSFTDS